MAFSGFRKIRCPFCAEEYRLGEFAIYSETEATITKEASRGALGSFIGSVRSQSLEGKKNTLNRKLRQCPNCQGLLPFNIEYVEDNITLAIIGDSFSGKSHFIASAIKQLKERRIPPEIGLTSFNASASRIEERYKRDYYDPLFKRGEPLPHTVPAISPIDDPLIYEMRIGGRFINLLIYDASGEDIANIDTNITNKPHILNARALIFLADPWSMPGFVDQLAHHLRPEAGFLTGRMTSDVLNMVITVFRRALGEVTRPRFSLPVAIALSKSDLIPYVVTRSGDPLYQALSERQFPSSLTRAESEKIHEVVRKFLYEVKEDSLVSMEQVIERVNFSAITATGISLDGQGKYTQVEPHRCLDPLFWILRELEIIP